MTIQPLLQAIYDWQLSDAIRLSEAAFPWLECIHVLSICLVVGMISIVDLRLLGVHAHTPSVRVLERQALPIVWVSFAMAAASGAAMFASNATGYAKNPDFQYKMALLVLVFVNMLFFHVVGRRRLTEWDEAPQVPIIARLAGLLSLMIWIAVVFFGRRIGFTLSPF